MAHRGSRDDLSSHREDRCGAGGGNGLGAHAGLRDGDRRSGAAGAERISGCREPHPQGASEWSAEAIGRRAKMLGEMGHRLGRKALADVATVARPDTILGWYRKLVARKFDGSKVHRGPGRPRIKREVERLIIRMA